jgi:hypothetical protein
VPRKAQSNFLAASRERVLHVADCARCGGGGPRCSPLPQKYPAPLQPGGAFFCPRFSCRAFTIYFCANIRLPRLSVIPTSIAARMNSILDPSSAMRWHTSSASSSSAGIADDIFRLIPSNMRPAFREMLEMEFRGRELIAHEKRRAAERIWHKFLKHGWPADS